MSVLHVFLQLILLWLTICTEKVVTSEKNNREDLPSLHCHADHRMKEYYHQNKDAFKEMQLFQIKTRQSISTRKTSKSYVIPVVFHVYGTDFAGQSVNDKTIINALEKLNNDFHGLNSDFNTVHPVFQGNRSTFDVTFKLPRKDPNGNPTTGIIYYPAKNGYGTDAFNSDIQREAWDNYKYCNIYIQLDLYGDGVLTNSGLAWYPASAMSSDKLARIVYNGRYLYGNTEEEFSSVLTHEFGHWLNLIHTFEDGCTSSFENQCELTGDQVCDTPQTAGSQGCFATSNCLGKLVNSENYMDYSGAYGCYKMFTAGQVDRMKAAMDHPARITLWQHENLVATGLAD